MQISSTPDQECYAIILAAGASGRMGRPKADLPWLDGKPLLAWTMDALIRAGWNSRVVLSPSLAATWIPRLPSNSLVVNPRPERGKITSLVAGVEVLPRAAKWILITAIDQPRPPALYQRLREEVESATQKILVPNHLGHRGHPIVLSGALRDELLAVREDSFGLRGFLDAHREETRRLPGCDPSWLRWDFNTPDAYEEAFAFFSALPA